MHKRSPKLFKLMDEGARLTPRQNNGVKKQTPSVRSKTFRCNGGNLSPGLTSFSQATPFATTFLPLAHAARLQRVYATKGEAAQKSIPPRREAVEPKQPYNTSSPTGWRGQACAR